MLYIIVALKPEAQAFVDRYKLTKSKLDNFTIFSDKNMILIVSGIGINNSTIATQTLINHYDITDDDIYMNIGICGASKDYKIGELLEINEVRYGHSVIKLNNNSKNILNCVDIEVSEDGYEIVDMESFGFYDAVIHSPAIKKIYILKVVSDNFEPNKVTKDSTKSLVFNVIDGINEIIQKKDKK